MASGVPDREAARELAQLFRRNGHVRWPDEDRRSRQGRAYKKGYEVRLSAGSLLELVHLRRLLTRAGFALAKYHAKAGQYRQPIYGQVATQAFLAMVAEVESDPRDGSR